MPKQHNISEVTLQRVGHTALITLNRPDAMNAVNSSLAAALGAALEELAGDEQLRVGVLTGSGRAFCAGADLKELAAGRRIDDPAHPEWGFAGMVKHFVDKPLIAAVNGFALGGGTEIVLACDLAVMNETTTLGLPEVRHGLAAIGGGLLRLPRQIPRKLAMQAVLTGDPIDAPTAAAWGMVNDIVAPDLVLDTALRLAKTIGDNAPLSVRASKRIMTRSADFGSDWNADIWAMCQQEVRPLYTSADAQEGPRAFAEKRAPRWQGK
ncbi:crotonase/enoyl-CoA hydratase family protein [Nocardia nova]|uniref:crotonase/enoyl-CoA hydratase family protein n=1 Tax=Nocardia nova TaxID=37330 RepID=UPI0033F5F53A